MRVIKYYLLVLAMRTCYCRKDCWFDTPNHCGAFLAMTAVVSMVLFLFLKDRGWGKWKAPLLAAGILRDCRAGGGACNDIFAGGYVALAVGIMFTWMMDRRKWAGFYFVDD